MTAKKLQLSENQKSKFFRGIVFDRIPVRNIQNSLQNTWVIGFYTEFSSKDAVKAFCNEHQGSWDSEKRFWFVPLQGSTVKDLLPQFWDIAIEAIKEIGEHLPEYCEISININMGKHSEVVKAWLEKKIRYFNSQLAIVPESKVLPFKGNNLPTEEECLDPMTPQQIREYEEDRLLHWQGKY